MVETNETDRIKKGIRLTHKPRTETRQLLSHALNGFLPETHSKSLALSSKIRLLPVATRANPYHN
jgi:hypothetical protein